MSGHSKWSKIKRQKAANDSKRGKVFTRCLKEIQVAAKLGGSDIDSNHRLKRCVDSAKSQGVPTDNIEKAIQRGAGEIDGADYEEVMYEAYGPAGIGVIIKTLTDSKNRTVGEVRHALSKNGGNLASSNAVAYQFAEKAVFTVPKNYADEDKLMEIILEAGADDIEDSEDVWEVYSAVSEFEPVIAALKKLGEDISGELRMIPQNTIAVSGEDADKVIQLMECLDDLDDVQGVFSNFDLAE